MLINSMAKKREEKFKKLGLTVPAYQARFTKDFPHLDPNQKEELVEIDEDEDQEGEVIFDAGGYRSEKEIDQDLKQAEEEVEQEKKGFFKWLFGKEHKENKEQKVVTPVELSRVQELTHKILKKEVPIVTETEEGEIIMQPREENIVKREKTEVETGFEIPAEILHAKKTEKFIAQTKKIKLPQEKKMEILSHIEKHKPRVYTKPYADYASLKDDLHHLNKKLAALH